MQFSRPLLLPALQREAVTALAAPEPLRHTRHGRGRRMGTLRHLEVRQSLVEQLRHLPAVSHRIELRDGAKVAEQAPRLFRRLHRRDRREELVVILRLCHRVTMLTR